MFNVERDVGLDYTALCKAKVKGPMAGTQEPTFVPLPLPSFALLMLLPPLISPSLSTTGVFLPRLLASPVESTEQTRLTWLRQRRNAFEQHGPTWPALKHI